MKIDETQQQTMTFMLSDQKQAAAPKPRVLPSSKFEKLYQPQFDLDRLKKNRTINLKSRARSRIPANSGVNSASRSPKNIVE